MGTTDNSRQKLHPWVHSFVRKASIKVLNVENTSHLGHVSGGNSYDTRTEVQAMPAGSQGGKLSCAAYDLLLGYL